MACCGEGSKSSRWVQMRVPVLVGMPVWWSIQRRPVLRVCFAAWGLILATSRTAGEWLWVIRCRSSEVRLVWAAFTSSCMVHP